MFIFILIHLIYTWIQDTKFIYKSSHQMNVSHIPREHLSMQKKKNAFNTLTTKIKYSVILLFNKHNNDNV